MKIRFILSLFLAFMFVLTACQSKSTQEMERKATDTSESKPFYATSEPKKESESNADEQIKPENSKEYLLDGKNAETVLCFVDGRDIIQPIASKDTINFNYTKDNDGEKKAASIIAEYLQERGMLKENPDGFNIVDGVCSVEYYADNEKQKYSVVMRLLDRADYVGVFATTYALDDFTELGDIIFDCNSNGDVISEKFYNTAGELTSDIIYKYYESIPFPFILKHIITDELCYEILNRGQRFWVYEDFAVKGETGEVAGEVAEYTQDIYRNKYSDAEKDYSIRFTYDTNGRLNVLSEDFIAEDDDPFHEEDWTSDILSLEYQENGALKKADYHFEMTFSYELPQNSRHRGTWYSSGEISYDEHGRVVCRRDYVTHGSHYSFYLYDGASKRPWSCIELCGMPYLQEENYYSGNETTICHYSAIK